MIIRSYRKTRYWHRLPDGRVQCDLCPRACRLKEGQQGFCFVRTCVEGEIVLTSYGRSSGFCVDPIEKKPFYHFLPGTPVLSFGTAGCNLSCKFCQNWDMSKSREMDTLAARADPETIARAAQQSGCRSVAYTYNDPVIFLEYARDTALACRALGIRNLAVTAGYLNPEAWEDFFSVMDGANVDLKAFREDFYRRLCGGHLQPVLETLEYLRRETTVWLELTTLLIPGYNEGEKELQEMTQWVVEHLGPEVPMHFTAFHPDWQLRQVPPTPAATLRKAREIALANGVRYAYTGNVYDPVGTSTYCSKCRALLIGRNGYELTAWHLDGRGCCKTCGTPCAGRFEAQPGNWGNRRLPLSPPSASS